MGEWWYAQEYDCDILDGETQAFEGTPRLYVDATGVGQPLIDLLDARARGVAVIATTFTHGDQRAQVDPRTVRLGKAYLVSRLQALLRASRVHLPRTAEAEALARELLDYEICVDENANDRCGAFKVGTHDDLVTALGLAVQQSLAAAPGLRGLSPPAFRGPFR